MSWLGRIFPAPKSPAKGGHAGRLRGWLLRGAVGVMGLGLLAWGGAWVWASGAVHRAGDAVAGVYYGTTADMGFRVERVLVEGPFGFVQLDCRAQEGRILFEERVGLQVENLRVPVSQYEAFREFCAEVDRAEEQPVILEKTSG